MEPLTQLLTSYALLEDALSELPNYPIPISCNMYSDVYAYII